jgi:hypothetical protein
MEAKFIANISKEDCVSFFNLCALPPQKLRKTEFERQTQKKYATTIADKIHNEDLKIYRSTSKTTPD